MNAVKLLKDDHKKVKGLFREFEGAGERAFKTKLKLAREIFTELEVHTEIEEEIFYPAAKRKGDKEIKETIDEGLQEHHVVKVLIEELRALDIEAESDTYVAKMTVLIENVEHHINEEERELLPQAQKLLGAAVDTLGEQLAARKQQLQQATGAATTRAHA